MMPSIHHEPDQEVADLARVQFVDPRADKVMEHFRKKLVAQFGVTVSGPFVTLRDTMNGHSVWVTMQVTDLEKSDILTPHDSEWNK